MRFLRLLLPAQDIAAAFAARSMADLHTGGSRIAESTASSRVGGRGGGAVLNTAADAIVNELSLLGTLCRRVRLLGSAEGYRAVSSRPACLARIEKRVGMRRWSASRCDRTDEDSRARGQEGIADFETSPHRRNPPPLPSIIGCVCAGSRVRFSPPTSSVQSVCVK